MTTIRWSLGLFLFALVGCASEPVELNYYLLHSPSLQSHAPDAPVKHKVFLQKLVLPSYLKQRSLVMQTSPAKLHFSSSHVWAEPLESGFVQALSETLWQQANILTIPFEAIPSQQNVVTVSLHIDDFLPTHRHEVVLKGKYWLESEALPPRVHLFDLRLPLKQDGFDHSVNLMRALVRQLSEDIARHLDVE